MIPETYNFPDHYNGDTFQALTITLDDDGTPIPLTGASIAMALRFTGGQTLRLETGSGITITDAVNGEFQIDKQIINVPATTYKYDIQVTFANGDVETYLAGTWTIIDDSTK